MAAFAPELDSTNGSALSTFLALVLGVGHEMRLDAVALVEEGQVVIIATATMKEQGKLPVGQRYSTTSLGWCLPGRGPNRLDH